VTTSKAIVGLIYNNTLRVFRNAFSDPLLKQEGAGPIDYDARNGNIYFINSSSGSIVEILGSNRSMLRTVVDGIGVSDGLAVDWTSDYIYYTDSTYDVIAVVHVSGTPKKIVIETMLDDPRSIAVDPNNAMIYWTSWGGSPKIERAYMSGKARTTLIGQDLSRPNAVVLDFDSRKLFWGDWGLDTVECHVSFTYLINDDIGRNFILD
jgi:low density lipoprotein receptor-related protein 5/6